MYIGVIRGPFCCYDSSPAANRRGQQEISRTWALTEEMICDFFFFSSVAGVYRSLHEWNNNSTDPSYISPLLWGVDDGSRPAVTSQTFRNWHFLYIQKEMEGISYGGTIYKTILWHWWVFRCCCCVYINLKRETMSDPVILCLFAPSYDNSTLYTI